MTDRAKIGHNGARTLNPPTGNMACASITPSRKRLSKASSGPTKASAYHAGA